MFPGPVVVLLVATATLCCPATGIFAVEAVGDIEGKDVVDIVAVILAWATRTRAWSDVWEELGAEAFGAKATLGTGGKPLFPPLAWTSTTELQQPASSIRYLGLP